MTQPLTVTLEAAAGAPFAAGTQTLLPGQELAVRKHVQHDVMLFIHKGQARATIGGQSMAVVPGAMLYAPRGTWCGLRNTGTGALQVAWAGTPGIEAVFRDLAALGPSPSSDALQEIAQRHQIEFRPAGATPAPSHAAARRGRRPRGRRGGRPRAPVTQASPSVPPAAGLAAPAAPAVPTPHRHPAHAPRRPDRGPRRRRGARPTPSVKPPHAGARSGRAPQRPRKVKEVYMGGQWIKVEGDGPVIAPSRKRLDPNRNRDDDTPPLSFNL